MQRRPRRARGLKVNSIAPGLTETPMTERDMNTPGLVELFSRAGADLPGALREMHARAQLTGQEKLFPPAFQSLAASLR